MYRNKIPNIVWEKNVFKYKYRIVYFEKTQNTCEIGVT